MFTHGWADWPAFRDGDTRREEGIPSPEPPSTEGPLKKLIEKTASCNSRVGRTSVTGHTHSAGRHRCVSESGCLLLRNRSPQNWELSNSSGLSPLIASRSGSGGLARRLGSGVSRGGGSRGGRGWSTGCCGSPRSSRHLGDPKAGVPERDGRKPLPRQSRRSLPLPSVR